MSQIATETDEIDEQILERLEDSPRSIAQIASVTGMRIRDCRQRVRRLTDAGLIGEGM
jgi:DNA-binding Lrp family transcriptional regulator